VFCNGVVLCCVALCSVVCAASAAKHRVQWRRFRRNVGEGSGVERCSAVLTGQYLTDISVD